MIGEELEGDDEEERHRSPGGAAVRSGTSDLTYLVTCSTVYDMKNAVTIRLDPGLQKELDRICRRLRRTRSDIVRDALRRQLALLRFERLRRQAMPFAEARGYLTDEDVSRMVS